MSRTTREDHAKWLEELEQMKSRDAREKAAFKNVNDVLVRYGLPQIEYHDSYIVGMSKVMQILDMISAVTVIKQKIYERRLMNATDAVTLKDLRDALYVRMERVSGHRRAVVMATLRALSKHREELRLFFKEDFDDDKRMAQIPLSYFNEVTAESLLRQNNFGLKKLEYLRDALAALGVGDVRGSGDAATEGCDGHG